MQDIDSMPHLIPPCVVDLEDAKSWQQTAMSMKSGKAIGYDGFRAEELHLLPTLAFRHLAHIVSCSLAQGIAPSFLCARTVLLAKVARPEGINHGRPITIFGVLVRLISKHIAKQLLHHWARYMPSSISGGLPNRGVQDLVMAQQAIIERNLFQGIPTMGYTLDLVKAFNTLPRRVIGRLMIRFGAPQVCVDFWLTNLKHMKRKLQQFQVMGQDIDSTTGCPEGDCLAVAAMVALSFYFHFQMSRHGPMVFTYADNWSWLTNDEQVMLQCFHCMVRIARNCRLTVDFAKSWVWTTNAKAQHLFDKVRDEIPEQVCLIYRDHAKDLGVTINYSKQRRIGPFRERFDTAIQSFQKVFTLDIPMKDKARLIQSSLYPRALYGAEFTAPSEDYFRKMRRQVCKAIVSDSNHASSDVACHMLLPNLQDPFVCVMANLLRTLRRYLVLDPIDAMAIIDVASKFDGKRSYGPGSALSLLLARVGWYVTSEAILVCGSESLSLPHSCNSEIVRFLDLQWTTVVHGRCLQRKGFLEEKVLSARLTRRVFGLFTEQDKKIISQYVCGSFQSDSVKAMWDKTCDGKCQLCGGDDTKDHRTLRCPALGSLRSEHPEAISTLSSIYPEWTWAPIAYLDPNEVALRRILTSRRMPDVFVPGETKDDVLHFYTDGSADHSSMPWIRRGAFSVVQDMSDSLDHRRQLLSAEQSPCLEELFAVRSMSHCPGKQSVPRAELAALLHVVQSVNVAGIVKHTIIYTDAAYVMSVVKWLHDGASPLSDHKVANLDLILPLRMGWSSSRFSVKKVKAHESIALKVLVADRWNALGNDVADTAAKHARSREFTDVVDMVRDVKEFDAQQHSRLVSVFSYMAALSTRMRELNSKKPSGQPQQAVPLEEQLSGKRLLIEWCPDNHSKVPKIQVEPEMFQAITCGNVFGSAVWDWIHTISWNDDVSPVGRRSSDPGITWLELVVNFTLMTGMQVPLIYNRCGQIVSWMWHDDPQAELLPKKARTVAAQVLIFAGVVRMLQSLSGSPILRGPRGEPSSLWHLGFRRKRNGFLRRPILMRHDETLEVSSNYLQQCHPAWDDVFQFRTDKSLDLSEVSLPHVGPKERWNLYLRLLKVMRKWKFYLEGRLISLL